MVNIYITILCRNDLLDEEVESDEEVETSSCSGLSQEPVLRKRWYLALLLSLALV